MSPIRVGFVRSFSWERGGLVAETDRLPARVGFVCSVFPPPTGCFGCHFGRWLCFVTFDVQDSRSWTPRTRYHYSHSQTWARRSADRDPRWTRMHFDASSSSLIMIVCTHGTLRTSLLAWKIADQTEERRCPSRGNDPWFDSRVMPACTSWQPLWGDGNRIPYLQDVPDLQFRKRTLRESARKNDISPLDTGVKRFSGKKKSGRRAQDTRSIHHVSEICSRTGAVDCRTSASDPASLKLSRHSHPAWLPAPATRAVCSTPFEVLDPADRRAAGPPAARPSERPDPYLPATPIGPTALGHAVLVEHQAVLTGGKADVMVRADDHLVPGPAMPMLPRPRAPGARRVAMTSLGACRLTSGDAIRLALTTTSSDRQMTRELVLSLAWRRTLIVEGRPISDYDTTSRQVYPDYPDPGRYSNVPFVPSNVLFVPSRRIMGRGTSGC